MTIELSDYFLNRAADVEALYPVAVGSQFLYLSADRHAILGPDTLETDGATFYLGFKR